MRAASTIVNTKLQTKFTMTLKRFYKFFTEYIGHIYHRRGSLYPAILWPIIGIGESHVLVSVALTEGLIYY